MIFTPNGDMGLEYYVDAAFAGGWDRADSGNPEAVLSRTGYVLMYATCPVLFCSKLQTEIAISTTESEYIALSQATREVLPLINLLKEINAVFPLNLREHKFHYNEFEDNNSCIPLATAQKFSPRTKHIALKYHHFRSFAKDKTLGKLSIDTTEQIADIFTKPLDEAAFIYLRKKLNGW